MTDIVKKEVVIKDEPAFRLRLEYWKCLSPKDLNSINIIQDCMREGEVDFSTTYNFLMTDDEIKTLIKGLENIIE